ncbi:MAG: DUF5671 domain-containing protein [Candidatus Pacebacteria bacterium]|nr:DUF5671 domain-containing protein [Candidatus Paceibacterota bacterium]
MEPTKKETAKDLFLHLLSAATLYLSVIGFITLWWQYINFAFPDKLNVPGYGSSIYNTLIWGTSMVAVTFPVYILISWIIGKDFKKDPTKRETGVRKWLWYITLFVSAMTIIIDLVTLVYNFLKGDLTIQFFLKLIVILVVAAAVFGYYLWDLRKRELPSEKPRRLAWITGAAIFASIIFGFLLVGTPAKQRDLRFDEQRVGDLQQLEDAVVRYWQSKNQLPKSADDLKVLGYSIPKDPETGKVYEYSVTGDLSFAICADFKTEFKPDPNLPRPQYLYFSQTGVNLTPQNWEHAAGHACFGAVIDRDFFKNLNVPAEKLVPPVM